MVKNLRCAADIVVMSDSPEENTFFLGQPFLRKFYTIYDRENLKVGLSKSSHRVDIRRLRKEIDIEEF
jgi:hypothetical protein